MGLRHPQRFLVVLASAGACLLPGAAAHAATVLPPMGWQQQGVSNVTFGGLTVLATNPPTPVVSVAGTGGSASLQFSPTPTPSITAFATGYDTTVPSTASGSAFTQGVFRYDGVVETTDPNTAVDTTVSMHTVGSLFSENATTGFGSNAQARLEVNGQSVFGLRVSDQGANTGSFASSLAAAVRTNTAFLVEMSVRAWTFETGVTASAFLDPYFTSALPT